MSVNRFQPYEEKLNHPADFRVKYRFYDEAEGGRKSIPYQGIRSDFWYFHPDQPNPNSIYMIWPEFEDEHGNVITEVEKSVPQSGTARMWIIVPERREFHRERIYIGTKGYFMEGSHRTAECEVIEILGLKTNPTTSH